MALSRSKIIHRAGHSVISHNACARARHTPTLSVKLTAVRFLFRKQNNGIFRWYLSCHPVVRTLMSVLWAYFISPLKIFILNGCWFCKRKIHSNRFRRGLGHGKQAGKTIILLRALAHPSGPRCHRGCGIRCLASSFHQGLWSSFRSNFLQSCSALSNIHHSLLLRAQHGSK